jgi:hypothetical protein
MGNVAFVSASQAAAVTFNYTVPMFHTQSILAPTESQFSALKEGARPGSSA